MTKMIFDELVHLWAFNFLYQRLHNSTIHGWSVAFQPPALRSAICKLSCIYIICKLFGEFILVAIM